MKDPRGIPKLIVPKKALSFDESFPGAAHNQRTPLKINSFCAVFRITRAWNSIENQIE